MRIDRKAAPIVADAKKARRLVTDIDEAGVARNRLIHCIVEDFREEMMERSLAGAADEHARPPADGPQPLQHFDRSGGIVQFAGRFVVWRRRRLPARSSGRLLAGRIAEKIATPCHAPVCPY